jgi:hypothetical protein
VYLAAGSGSAGAVDGPALSATLSNAKWTACDAECGTVFIADSVGRRIRALNTTAGWVSTVAGNGVSALTNAASGGSASFIAPSGLAWLDGAAPDARFSNRLGHVSLGPAGLLLVVDLSGAGGLKWHQRWCWTFVLGSALMLLPPLPPLPLAPPPRPLALPLPPVVGALGAGAFLPGPWRLHSCCCSCEFGRSGWPCRQPRC